MACAFFFLTPNKRELQSAEMPSVGNAGDLDQGAGGERGAGEVLPRGEEGAQGLLFSLRSWP